MGHSLHTANGRRPQRTLDNTAAIPQRAEPFVPQTAPIRTDRVQVGVRSRPLVTCPTSRSSGEPGPTAAPDDSAPRSTHSPPLHGRLSDDFSPRRRLRFFRGTRSGLVRGSASTSDRHCALYYYLFGAHRQQPERGLSRPSWTLGRSLVGRWAPSLSACNNGEEDARKAAAAAAAGWGRTGRVRV